MITNREEIKGLRIKLGLDTSCFETTNFNAIPKIELTIIPKSFVKETVVNKNKQSRVLLLDLRNNKFISPGLNKPDILYTSQNIWVTLNTDKGEVEGINLILDAISKELNRYYYHARETATAAKREMHKYEVGLNMIKNLKRKQSKKVGDDHHED